jgi:hypothetical protein
VIEDAAEPRFSLRPGSSAGSESVDVTYHDTVAGTTYRLVDVSRDREIDTDTAASPVTFSTDGETDTYLIEEKPASSTGPAVGVGATGSGGGNGDPLSILALLGGMALSVVGTAYAGRRWLGATGTRASAVLLVVGSAVGIVGIEAVTPRSVLSDLLYVGGGAFGDVVGAAGSAVGTAVAGFAASGAGTVVIGLAILLGVYLLDRRIGVPRWFLWIAGVGTVIWVLNSLSGGAFVSTLSTIGPLAWLVLLIGGVVLVWRALQPTTIQVTGEEQ